MLTMHCQAMLGNTVLGVERRYGGQKAASMDMQRLTLDAYRVKQLPTNGEARRIFIGLFDKSKDYTT